MRQKKERTMISLESKGVEMEIPVMYESVNTIVRTIDSEELSIRA